MTDDDTERREQFQDTQYIIERLERGLEKKRESDANSESIEYTKGKIAGAKIVRDDLLTEGSLRKNQSVRAGTEGGGPDE